MKHKLKVSRSRRGYHYVCYCVHCGKCFQFKIKAIRRIQNNPRAKLHRRGSVCHGEVVGINDLLAGAA